LLPRLLHPKSTITPAPARARRSRCLASQPRTWHPEAVTYRSPFHMWATLYGQSGDIGCSPARPHLGTKSTVERALQDRRSAAVSFNPLAGSTAVAVYATAHWPLWSC
jgi:hypothetical protein